MIFSFSFYKCEAGAVNKLDIPLIQHPEKDRRLLLFSAINDDLIFHIKPNFISVLFNIPHPISNLDIRGETQT